MSPDRLVWTRTARGDVRAIHEYIARDSPYYAHQTVDGIRRAAERLGRSFELGSIVLEWNQDDIREVYSGNYRVIAQRRADCVTVLTVIHMARQLPDRG